MSLSQQLWGSLTMRCRTQPVPHAPHPSTNPTSFLIDPDVPQLTEAVYLPREEDCTATVTRSGAADAPTFDTTTNCAAVLERTGEGADGGDRSRS